MPSTDEEKNRINELEKKIRLLERKLSQANLSQFLIEEANERNQNIYKHLLTQVTRQKEELETARNILSEKTIQLEAANLQLKIAKENAEQSTRFKSEFLANMSHEVRTPMNAVIGYISLLEKTDLNNAQGEYVDEIKNASELLLFLANDILDLSKIEAGKMKFEYKNFELKQVIRESVSLNIPKAEEKKIYLKISYDESIPEILSGDPMRLKQVFNNLISNAIKFTDKGGVTIEATYTGQADNREQILISVTDTGSGIKEDEKNILFEPFVQSRLNDYEVTGGTGLGLTICKKIITQMGSDISVDSEFGRGSKFYFTLFLERGKTREQESQKLEEVQKEITFDSNLSILVAEDNKISMKLFLKFLEKLGLKADIAYNGNEVVEKSREKAYSLIFIDNTMPSKTGYEAVKEIRESGKSRNAIIIGISGNAFKEEMEKLYGCGMNDFITKPIMLDKLREKISKYF